MTNSFTLSTGRLIGGKYKIERKIAQGGMSTVYHVSTAQEQLALKLMDEQFIQNPQLKDLFDQEVRIGEELSLASDYAANVIDHGIDESIGLPYVVMELLEGEILNTFIDRGGGLTVDLVRDLFCQLCDVLGAAHQRGIVHCDLKPANIFITTNNRLKVLDFGLAKMLSAVRAQNSFTFGTLAWSAPEQIRKNGEITRATDVWALGLIGFYMLTGKSYWLACNEKQPDPTALVKEICDNDPPLESASARAARLGCGGKIQPPFDEWFSKCVARAVGVRLQDAGEVLHELRKLPTERVQLRKNSGATPSPARAAPKPGRLAVPASMPGTTSPWIADSEVVEDRIIQAAATVLRDRIKQAMDQSQSAFIPIADLMPVLADTPVLPETSTPPTVPEPSSAPVSEPLFAGDSTSAVLETSAPRAPTPRHIVVRQKRKQVEFYLVVALLFLIIMAIVSRCVL